MEPFWTTIDEDINDTLKCTPTLVCPVDLYLFGEEGNDTIDFEPYHEEQYRTAVLDGGPGDDHFWVSGPVHAPLGNKTVVSILGGDGNDEINLGGEIDFEPPGPVEATISCGPGFDSVVGATADDHISSDCEYVNGQFTQEPAPLDSDHDGIKDPIDKCPYLAGPGPTGCPPPIAKPDEFWTAPGKLLKVSAPGVLCNDSDPQGLPLNVQVLSISFGTSSHTYALNPKSGALNFDPGPSTKSRKATITYDVSDSAGLTSTPATITILIQSKKPKLDQCAAFDDAGNLDFDWEMTARDTSGPAKVNPPGYNVTLGVGEPGAVDVKGGAARNCQSYPEATAYRWTIGAFQKTTSSCALKYEFKKLGSYNVKLEAMDGTEAIDEVTKRIEVKDWLILVLGDSYASGEGNPPFVDGGGGRNTPCDRSPISGGWEAAEKVEELDPRTSVTLVDLACTGATVAKGNGGNNIPHQIEEARGQLEGQRVPDAVVLSGGGDDLHFKSVIEDCIKASAVRNGGYAGGLVGHAVAKIFKKNCGSANKLVTEHTLAGLEASYRNVRDELAELKIPSSAVYLTEYADPTHDDDGSICSTATLDQIAFRWAYQHVLVPLNEVAERAAHVNGWEFVGRIASAFKRHGYCANASWFHSLPNSVQHQHSLNGTFHPNHDGQRCYARNITAHLEATLYLVYPESLLPRPDYAFDKNNPCPS
jgi:Ca2+-binding RTX toxin-like protein